MRIVGGDLRGRRLITPKTDATRPTSDRTRESLFNILGNHLDFEGLIVMDLFAGTGALGLEAISRGAGFCTFMEMNRAAATVISRNIDELGLGEKTKLLKRDATKPGAPGEPNKVNLVFADPPYGKKLGERAARALIENDWLAPDALFILEERADCMPDQLPGFEKQDERKFGDTKIAIFSL